MIFDVLRSQVGFSKWQDQKTRHSLTFDVVPQDRYYLEIGENFVVQRSSYHRVFGSDREQVECSVSISDDPESIAHIKSKKPVVGYAYFSPPLNDVLSPRGAKLFIAIVVEPEIFGQMLRTPINAANTASVHVDIEGLEFGGEPDGTHSIWNLDAECNDFEERQLPVSSFWLNAETFWTHEAEIGLAEDRRQQTLLAHSHKADERELAADLMATAPQPPAKPDPVVKLLDQCRVLLGALLVLGLDFLFFRR